MASNSTVIRIAQGELGYAEKATNSQLQDKKANAGSGNYTKYAPEIGHANGLAWCQTFVNWCFFKAYGNEANSLLCGGLGSASTMTVKDCFQSHGQLVDFSDIQPGDIVWRSRNGGGHVELVVRVNSNGTFSTIGGNTDDGGSWNGGAVVQHDNQSQAGKGGGGNWQWCGHPRYTDVQNVPVNAATYHGGPVQYANVDGSYGQHWQEQPEEMTVDISGFLSSLGNISFNKTYKQYTAQFEERTYTITRDTIQTVDTSNVHLGGSTNLVSYPSLVEVPFVLFKVGKYTFGKYSKVDTANGVKIDFPNYINSLQISKINGQLNQYTISIDYQISTGDDPNLLDKIFSSVGYGKVYISYGDYSSPSFIYKEEEAIITNVSSSVNFEQSRISYTVKCTSTALLLASNVFDFPTVKAKPSTIIQNVLYNASYGLTQIFTGMSSKTQVAKNNLIPTDDKEIEIHEKKRCDPLTYIQYLVTCMSASSNGDGVLKDSTYRMTIFDDNFGDLDLNGPYFKITKIASSSKALATADTYEVDIGYPTENQVMSFSVKTDNSWNLLYNYSDTVDVPQYTYDIDSSGKMITSYSPSLATSSHENRMTEQQKTWWTNMTQFPISATLTLKGLVRPSILMTYVRVNALFFGQKHVASGLYIITGQNDIVSTNGYSTTLALQRIAGDNDYIQKTQQTVTSQVLTGYSVEEKSVSLPIGQTITQTLGNVISSAVNVVTGIGGAVVETAERIVNPTMYSDSGNIEQNVWNALMSVLNNPYGVAGVMGNLKYESGMKPNKLEGLCIQRYTQYKNVTYTDKTYTDGVDSGAITKEEFLYPLKGITFAGKSTHQYGYGLAQWTSMNRKEGLYNLCRSRNASIADEKCQVEWLLHEIQASYPAVFSSLVSARSTDAATDVFLEKFEAPSNPNASRGDRRAYAKMYYDKFAK